MSFDGRLSYTMNFVANVRSIAHVDETFVSVRAPGPTKFAAIGATGWLASSRFRAATF
jgi:hypothetical protein